MKFTIDEWEIIAKLLKDEISVAKENNCEMYGEKCRKMLEKLQTSNLG